MMMFSAKKRLFAAAILSSGVLFSCTDDILGPPDNPNEGDGAIGFRSFTEKTRATEINNDNIADFRTWAEWTRDLAGNEVEHYFMNGVEVTKNGEEWVYSPLRYWPTTGHVDFFSHSPANSTGTRGSIVSKYGNLTFSGDNWTEQEEGWRMSPQIGDNGYTTQRFTFTTKEDNVTIDFEIKVLCENSYDRMMIGKPNNNVAISKNNINTYSASVTGFTEIYPNYYPITLTVPVTFPNAGENFIDFAYEKDVSQYGPVVYPGGDYGMYRIIEPTGFAPIGITNDECIVTYDVTTDLSAQEDFMVASALNRTSGPVTMNFNHVLSQVEFRIRSGVKGVSFRLHSLELRNLDRMGTLIGVPAGPGATEVQWEWTGNTDAQSTTYRVLRDGDDAPVESAYPSTATAPPAWISLTNAVTGNLMLLPQEVVVGSNERYTQDEIDADENDKITQELLNRPKDLSTAFYIVAKISSDTNYYPGTGAIPFHVDVPLYIPLYASLGADGVPGGGDDEAFEFEPGKKYTFMLELNDLNQVTFTLDIDDAGWSFRERIDLTGL